jgi:hypothetical protein
LVRPCAARCNPRRRRPSRRLCSALS